MAPSLFSRNCVLTHKVKPCKRSARGWRSVWQQRWEVGAWAAHLTSILESYFPKCLPLYVCIAQTNVYAMFTVFNVPIIDLGKCSMVHERQVFSLRNSVPPEVADSTGYVKCNHNSLWADLSQRRFGDRSFVESSANGSKNSNLTYFEKIRTKQNILSNHFYTALEGVGEGC